MTTLSFTEVSGRRGVLPPTGVGSPTGRAGLGERRRPGLDRPRRGAESTVVPGEIPADGFETWYRQQHPPLVAALTVASGSVDIAADATDEAFVRAYERWERVRRMDSPGGWLYRVALNLMRRQHRRRRVELELFRRSVPRTDVPPAAIDPDLWTAVKDLPTRQRTAVALRYVVDLTEHEVAEVMGVSRGAVSASLTAARRRLGRVVGDPPGAPGRPGPVAPPSAVQEIDRG